MTPLAAPGFFETVQLRVSRVFSAVGSPDADLFCATFSEHASAHPGAPTNRLANERASAMHAALNRLSVVPYGIPAMVGVMMDAHLALATSSVTKVFVAYRRGVAPEQFTGGGMREAVRMTERVLQSGTSASAALRRLLLKGGPFPGSVRYVCSQLDRCAALPGCRDAVAAILRASLVGEYDHCRTVAPMTVRAALQGKTASELLAWFSASGRNSYEYYYLVAEFVYAASHLSPLQWHWACAHPLHARHGALVAQAGDLLRRGGRPRKITMEAMPVKPVQIGLSYAAARAVVGSRKKLTVAYQNVLGDETTASVYRRVVCSASSSVGAILVSVGGPDFSRLSLATSEAVARREFGVLTERNRALFQVAVHAFTARDVLKVSPLSLAVTERQRRCVQERLGGSMYVVLICRCCATWRSKTSICGLSRGTIGVRIQFPVGSGIQCNACMQTWGIVAVDMVGKAVRVRPRIEAEPVWVVLCAACGIPSGDYAYVGVYPVCAACRTRPDPFASKARCFACPAATGLRVLGARKDGKSASFLACNAHWPKFAGYEACDISAIRSRVVPRRNGVYMRRGKLHGNGKRK